MGKHVLLLGGGHAHLTLISKIGGLVQRGHRVTLVQPAEYHYYSGMGPGMLGGTYQPGDIRFASRTMVENQGGVFIRSQAVHIDGAADTVVLDSGEAITYDVLSCNVGSIVPTDLADPANESVFSVKPIENLATARELVISLCRTRAITAAIIGGGPSAGEIAGNLHQLGSRPGLHRPRIVLLAGKSLMKQAPPRVAAMVWRRLNSLAVEVVTGARADHVDQQVIVLTGGESLQADVIFLAIGVKPSPLFAQSGIGTASDGGLPVNEYLQSIEYPNIFGGGDCIHFTPRPLAKVGVYAVRQNKVLAHNIAAAVDGGRLIPFDPGGDYLLIYNLGNGRGVLAKWSVVLGGRLAFMIKNLIDRSFMRKFQGMAG